MEILAKQVLNIQVIINMYFLSIKEKDGYSMACGIFFINPNV